jgi:hypothetical protein
MAGKTGAEKDAERRGGMRAIGRSLPKIAGKALGRHGLAEAGLVADWTAIVGDRLAEATLPVRLAFPRGERRDGTLSVRVQGSLALELQHLTPQLLERINGYLGYRGVERIKIERGPLPRAARHLAEPDAPGFDEAESEAAISSAVAGIGEAALRQSLARLGRAIGRDRKPRRTG